MCSSIRKVAICDLKPRQYIYPVSIWVFPVSLQPSVYYYRKGNYYRVGNLRLVYYIYMYCIYASYFSLKFSCIFYLNIYLHLLYYHEPIWQIQISKFNKYFFDISFIILFYFILFYYFTGLQFASLFYITCILSSYETKWYINRYTRWLNTWVVSIKKTM